jgi:hypothetical protein
VLRQLSWRKKQHRIGWLYRSNLARRRVVRWKARGVRIEHLAIPLHDASGHESVSEAPTEVLPIAVPE